MLKKSFIIVIMMLLIIGMCSNVQAVETKTKLNVVQSESGTKQLENSQGNISSKAVSYNGEAGTVKMQLSISNTKPTYENTEILIIVDENLANDEAKINQYISQVNSLVSIALKLDIKVGIIGIKGTISDRKVDSKGELVIGPKDQESVNGTANDAEVLIRATNDSQAITTALQNMNSGKVTYNSNLQAAIKLAKSSYSNNVNKILINTYENMPSTAIGVCKEVTTGKGETLEQATQAKNNSIISKTKTELLSLKNADIEFILLKLENTNSAQAQSIYGTSTNPTYGEIYSLDSGLTTTLLKMYQEFTKVKDTNMTSITVKVYFPKEIINNYHITLEESEKNVDATKYETDGYITWNIDTLKTGETANLQYTLQIDDIGNTSLLSKTISTNEKVEITYQDGKEEKYTTTLSSSPTVQLVNNQQQNTEKNTSSDKKVEQQDGTTANGNIPQTGVNAIILVGIASIAIAVVIFMYKKYNEYKDI